MFVFSRSQRMRTWGEGLDKSSKAEWFFFLFFCNGVFCDIGTFT